MFSITPNNPNPDLVKYVNRPLIKSISFNGFKYSYKVGEHTFYVGGIHSKLKSIYYPQFEVKKRQYRRKGVKRNKKASTKAQGILIDKQIREYVKTNKKPKNMLAKAIVSYVEDQCKSTFQGAQIPVFIKKFGIITQADVIIQSPKGELIMLEVKSGYNSARAQGTLNGLPEVPNTIKTQWELQRHFTEQGLKENGLPIKASYIINVYQDDTKIVVKKRQNPDWTKKLF